MPAFRTGRNAIPRSPPRCSGWDTPHWSCPRADSSPLSVGADSCLILCGTNITEAMFDQAVRSPELSPFLTGAYQARLLHEEGRQRLGLTLEYRAEQGATADLAGAIYPRLVQALGQAQPEFRDDWASIYRTWDNDPARRILKLDLVPWPEMSRGLEGKIKQRGIAR